MNKPKTAISKVESTAMAQQVQHQEAPQALSPIEQLTAMKDMGLTPADMKEMLAVQKDYDAMQAEKAFNIALANFKAEDILITKDKDVAFGQTAYSHASLGNVVSIAVPYMSKHGLSHRWKTEQGEGGLVTVTFVLTHIAGHSEETSLQAKPDDSGKKNAIQQVSSTITYLERYTFLAGTGLAVEDQNDDDGASAVEYVELISEEQSLTINSMITDNDLSMPIFMAWLGKIFTNLDSIDSIPATSYDAVVSKISDSIKAKANK